LLLSFEKKINKNQSQRMKYVDQPEKFMESEMELHKEINDLYAVSASPDLYPILVEAGSVVSILGMVAHENTDISIAAVGLLLELMDPETILESDDAICVVDAFLEGQVHFTYTRCICLCLFPARACCVWQGLELVVQNLSRLDEAVEEDAQGVHDSMAIVSTLRASVNCMS
jgi:beta-catenin-like protein 1